MRLSALTTSAALACALALAPAAAQARALSFTGSLDRSNPPSGFTGRCAPAAATVINNNIAPNFSTGTSNLGSFLNTASACINLPLTPPGRDTFDGEFTFDFGSGDTLFGTNFSYVRTTLTPRLLTIQGFFTVTGGTGRYSDASGSFEENGTLDFRTAGLALAKGNFTGTINTPAPGMAALFGLGAAGLALRLNRAPRRNRRTQSALDGVREALAARRLAGAPAIAW